MPIQEDLQAFLAEWRDPSPFLEVQTSGSTGAPKRMRVRKERMLNSARLTCERLGLRRGDKALLCMPLRYIAGKMMVVRALYAGLDLAAREPSGHPLADWDDTPLRFAAMIPLQVYNTLRVPEERERLERTEILIIGGGAVDAALEREIRQLPNAVYSTYGMTETLSHVALRRLNGPEASPYYQPLPSVRLSLSPEKTLVIEAPSLCDGRLVTNDIARLLPDGRFTIIGRRDNIINSGGIKIQIEEVEERLRPYLDRPYAITAAPDPRLGEAVVLLIAPPALPDGAAPSSGTPRHSYDEQHLIAMRCNSSKLPCVTPHSYEERLSIAMMCNSAKLSCEVSTAALAHLPKYLRPRRILAVRAIPRTGSGKTDRAACKELARRLTAGGGRSP
ncbi:AMP-binding protein [Parabacteroides sp. ZJ-118]|uniref:AMP-binding protein n=1 Tax=Parabacteroides sp. ZJ-118 TaxID=2709398 RepID=UPI0013EDEAA8|nr:AMP-binding protein [Parabacteroides sp. ZJ-118]